MVPDSGPLQFSDPVPGKIAVANEVDEWTFFGRAQRGVSIVLNPGTAGAPAALPPALGIAYLEIIAPNNVVIASTTSASNGALTVLQGVTLPIDGVYRVRVSAAAPASTGNYALTVYDGTVDVRPLTLNQRYNGRIESPFSLDRWTFSANAGQQIQFDLINKNSSSIRFQLIGPNGFTAFSGLAGDSDLITLPAAGNYTLVADALLGDPGDYAFNILETSQTALALGTTYAGSLPGSRTAQLFKVTLAEAKKLLVKLDDASSADHNELYLKFGSPPTRSDFQYKFDAPAAADQEILVPSAPAGDWFILVFGESVPNPSTFTLLATDGELFISKVTPDRGAANADLTLTITGAGFDSSTTVKLVAADSAIYNATAAGTDLPTQITATFAAGSIPSGAYSVRLDKAGGISAVFQNAVTIALAGQPKLEALSFANGARSSCGRDTLG